MDGSASDRFFSSLPDGKYIYLAGQTSSSDFPVTTNAVQPTYGGDDDNAEPGDMIIVKYNTESRAVEWATYFGGSGSDAATGLSLDVNGNLVVSGHTTSTDFPTMNPIQSENGGKSDAVIVKLSASGELLFSTYLGGVEDDQFSDTARDIENSSSIFVGFTASVDFPLPADNPSTADVGKPEAGNADYIVVALNDDNTLRWVTIPDTRRNLRGNDVANAVAVDEFGNILVTGYTESSNFVNSTLFGSFKGGRELFLAKIQGFNADREDSVLLGGSGDESGNDVALGFGVAVVVGQTNSPDIFTREVTFLQTTYGGGNSDALISAFAYTEFRMSRAATYFGGSGDDFGRAGVFDPNGYFHLAGATSSADLPFDRAPSNQPIQADNGGGSFDGFLVDIRASNGFSGPSINFNSASYYGGPGLEAIATIGLNPAEPAPGDRFEPYMTYFAGFASPPDAALQGRNLISFQVDENPDRSRAFLTAVSGVALLLPDLTVEIETREPLILNQEEKVNFFVRNFGAAPAENPSIRITPFSPIGLKTADIISVKYLGTTLQYNPDTEFYAIPVENNQILQGQVIEIEVTLKTVDIFTAASLPMFIGVATTTPELLTQNNNRQFDLQFIVDPDLAIRLVSADQDGIEVNPKKATFIYEITNLGDGIAENAFVDLEGVNLSNASYAINGAPAVNIGGLESVVSVPIGALEPAQKVEVRVEGELTIQKNKGAQVTATTKVSGDANPENNFAEATTTPPGELDYSVTIVNGYSQYLFEDGALVPVMWTEIELRLLPPDNVSLDQLPPAVLTIHHAGNFRSFLLMSPPNAGQCSSIDSKTTECSFRASDFFQTGYTPGLIQFTVSDYLDPVNIPLAAKVRLSVSGDGENPEAPNNYAEVVDDLSKKGRLSVTRVSHKARTIQAPNDELVVVVTQRIRVRNDGPGTVENIRVELNERDKFSSLGGGIFDAAQVIEGGLNGVTINTNSAQETIDIASLAANSGIIIELYDQLPLSATGGEVLGEPGILGEIQLTAPPKTDLTFFQGTLGEDDVLGNLIANSVYFPEDQSPDIEVVINNQYVGIQIINGSRQPQLVTELSISNIGTALASEVQLTLNASGVLSGGTISRPPNPFDVTYTQPGLPDDPMERLVSLGDIEPGASIKLVLKDVVADPGVDHLIGVSAMATHQSFDANLLNNSTSRDIEYQTYLQTLDYGVDFLTQTSERVMIDGFLVPVVRTRLEFSINADIGVESLPPFNLLFEHPGASYQTRLIPKDPNTPVPASGIQCQSISAVETACDFSAAIARDFLVEFIDRVITPTESQVSQSRADITGDGETPSNENNNRAASTFEYNATPVADVSVTIINSGGPSAVLKFRGSVTDHFLVRNLSSVETARNVLISVDLDADPAPSDAPQIPSFKVDSAGGNISAEAIQCLTSGNSDDCSIGDIEPGGERTISITTYFQEAPDNADEHPSDVFVRLYARSSGEFTLDNNQAIVSHETQIPDIVAELMELENGSKVFLLRVLNPKAIGGMETSATLAGPWRPVEGNTIPIEGDSGFVRTRPASGD